MTSALHSVQGRKQDREKAPKSETTNPGFLGRLKFPSRMSGFPEGFQESLKEPLQSNAGRADGGTYHEGTVGVGIVVSQIAGIFGVREGDGKGQRVVALPRSCPRPSCSLAIMISRREGRERRMSERWEELSFRCHRPKITGAMKFKDTRFLEEKL